MSDENKITDSMQEQKPIELVRKFELAIYEEDVKDDGSIKWNQVSYKQPVIIEAKNPVELNEKLNLYKQCGQMAKVIREIDPPSKEQLEAYIAQQNKAQLAKQQLAQVQVQTASQQIEHTNILQAIQETKYITTKPKYYKIAGISIKEQNGKVYQKQWIRLNDDEANQIRIVNDSNNKVLKLDNKHIEILKWIEIQKNEDNDSIIELN